MGGAARAEAGAAIGADVKRAREAKRERIEAHKLHADAGLTPEQEQLFEALRKSRSSLAKERGVPAYVILHDATMAQIAIRRPTSAEELESVPGIGRAKVASFGKRILETVRQTDTADMAGAESRVFAADDVDG
jgi:ATP-dependent DNA helicase RecQ